MMNELSFYEGYLEGKRRQEEIALRASERAGSGKKKAQAEDDKSWKFNKDEWEKRIKNMSDKELSKTHSHHLNYVPNSPVVHITHRELRRRGLK
jgi:hypothetical protein